MNRARLQAWLFPASLVLALLLQLAPMPPAWAALKPYWIGLVTIYWALETPERAGLGVAFAYGLLGDVVSGDLLGAQAMRLCILAFIVLRFRARIQFFPLWQQSLAVLALLLNDRVVALMVRGFSGEPTPPMPVYWFAPFFGMLVWPLLRLAIDEARIRLRARES